MNDIYLPVKELAEMCDMLLARAERAEAMTKRFMDLCVDMAGSGYYNPNYIDRYNVLYREWKEGQK